MIKRTFILALAGIMIIASACSKKITGNESDKQPPEPAVKLYQTNWVLQKMGTKTIKQEEDRKPISLIIDEESKNVSGYAGCNRYFGKIELKKDGITFSQMASTKMLCPPESMTIEEGLFRALEKIDNYVINGKELQLRKGESVQLVFIAL
jgi:heat shock protein HslJ